MSVHEGVRTERIEVRVSVQEKAALHREAQQAGFSSLSEYVRAVALFGLSVQRETTKVTSTPLARALTSPRLTCPLCEFSATSPKARCPVHGRTVR